jgi:hypothetical protein
MRKWEATPGSDPDKLPTNKCGEHFDSPYHFESDCAVGHLTFRRSIMSETMEHATKVVEAFQRFIAAYEFEMWRIGNLPENERPKNPQYVAESQAYWFAIHFADEGVRETFASLTLKATGI